MSSMILDIFDNRHMNSTTNYKQELKEWLKYMKFFLFR